VISAEDKDRALAAPPKLLAFEQRRRDSGLHFIDFLGREAKTDGITSLTAEPYTVHSTINTALQREAEVSLQEGLARFEMSSGRTQFRGPEPISATRSKSSALVAARQHPAPCRRGNKRCRRSSCRFPTCIGSPPLFSTKAAASAATAISASVSDTAAGSRSTRRTWAPSAISAFMTSSKAPTPGVECRAGAKVSSLAVAGAGV
jgi:hypothetical protein